MNLAPEVSVIIPTYNCSDFIAETLESVANQTFQNFECILIDDLSSDNTTDAINELIQIYGSKFKLIESQYNSGGPAIPRNKGIEVAKGKYICFLDADDIWHKDKLLHQVLFLDGNPEMDLVATETILIDKNSNKIPQLKIKSLLRFLNFKNRILFQNFFTLSSVMIRHKGIFFNTNPMCVACEDWLLWIEITYKKHNFYILKEGLTYYRILENSLLQRHTLKPYKKVFLVLNFLYLHEKISLLSMIIASSVNLIKLIKRNFLINILRIK